MISIVIPIFNEAENIGKLIPYLLNNSSPNNVSEIIIVDGGSTDGSRDSANKFLTLEDGMKNGLENPNNALVWNYKKNTNTTFSDANAHHTKVRLITSNKGRAKQMNAGAQKATGSILYFLHADSFPPQDFDQLLIDEIKNGNNAGCFRMQFDSNHWWLRLASWLTQFRWRACRGGDQSQFITRSLFEEVGGYDERYIIYEDNMLINELFARKQFTIINKKITTSARLYTKHGIWKVQYHFWSIYAKKWFGANSDDLYRYYKKHLSG